MTTPLLTIVAGEYWVAAVYAVTVGLGVRSPEGPDRRRDHARF